MFLGQTHILHDNVLDLRLDHDRAAHPLDGGDDAEGDLGGAVHGEVRPGLGKVTVHQGVNLFHG